MFRLLVVVFLFRTEGCPNLSLAMLLIPTLKTHMPTACQASQCISPHDPVHGGFWDPEVVHPLLAPFVRAQASGALAHT